MTFSDDALREKQRRFNGRWRKLHAYLHEVPARQELNVEERERVLILDARVAQRRRERVHLFGVVDKPQALFAGVSDRLLVRARGPTVPVAPRHCSTRLRLRQQHPGRSESRTGQ